MPENSSSCFRQIFSRCFKSDQRHALQENLAVSDQKRTGKCDCQVFISHSQSLAVKNGIAGDLYSHLQSLGIAVISGEQGISGDAISRAAVCIVILSKDYADSIDCLEELWLMHEMKTDLIPIFFDVKPSEVRRPEKGVFREVFERHGNERGVKEWKIALERTGLISGWKFSDFRGTQKLLKAVVQDVIKKVNTTVLEVAKYPVGLADKTEKLQRLLEAGNHTKRAKVLGIVGMGGIGKTTLAKEFFNNTRSQFKAACFVDDIKGKVAMTGLERVQSSLLRDLLQIDHQIHSTNQGKYLLKKCLLRSEVLIVFDNIDDSDQLDALWVPESVHRSSIILVTTRDRKLLECIPDSLIYDMEGLERKYAKELFCWHAFVMPHPALGFDVLVDHFITYCNGLPLSLETLGGKLFGEDLPVWEKTLLIITDSLPGDIERQLRVSYDALDWSEKQIFLDIASFFIGEDKEMAIKVWNALGWFGSVGFQSLLQKCLVKLENNRFHMHDQLREMAAKIVDGEDTDSPGRRSRLWRPDDVVKVLSQGMGSEIVQGLTLTVKPIQNERLRSFVVPKSEIIRNQNGGLPSAWSLRSFAPMTELRLLILEDACIEGDFGILSKKLLWFRWRHCPSDSFPVGLPVQNLRILDMSGGKLSSLWRDSNLVEIPVQLQELYLQGCIALQRFPKSIKLLSGLEKLVLSHCLSLVDIPDEFCDIKALKHVDLSGSSRLQTLPDRVGNLRNLQHLDLSNCVTLAYLPPSFGELEKLEHLDLQGCTALTEIPTTFHKLVEIRHLNLEFCWNLKVEFDIIHGFHKLEFLKITACKKFYMPRKITCQGSIRTLHISCSDFTELPSYLRELGNLEDLLLSNGPAVKVLEPFLFTKLTRLRKLIIVNFPLLEDLGISIGHLSQLMSLSISSCGLQNLPEEIGELVNLEHLSLANCHKLAKLPMTVRKLSALISLILSENSILQLDPEAFPDPSTIQKLCIGSCKVTDGFFRFICRASVSLRELKLENTRLPNMEIMRNCLPKLSSLSISSCTNIKEFEIFQGLVSLEIVECPGLKRIVVPFVNNSLQVVYLGHCKNLVEVCSVQNLRNLKNLNIKGCLGLQSVSGLEELNRLAELNLSLSDWYLWHGGNWLKNTINMKLPQVTHLSAKVDIHSHPLNLLSVLEKIPQHSSSEFKFKPNHHPRNTFCGFILCFISRHSMFDSIIVGSWMKDMMYQSIYLRLVNGANDIEISQYKMHDSSSFIHIGIYMDEFLVSEMFKAGNELVLSSNTGDLIYGAWICLIPTNEKHVVGEISCKLIENIQEHKMSIGNYVPPVELESQKLEDRFGREVIDMDLYGIQALDIANYFIRRTYTGNDVKIYDEVLGCFVWIKHAQFLFEGIGKLRHLDLELGSHCRNIVENPVIDYFEVFVSVYSERTPKTRTLRFAMRKFPPEGPMANLAAFDRITASHKAGFGVHARGSGTELARS